MPNLGPRPGFITEGSETGQDNLRKPVLNIVELNIVELNIVMVELVFRDYL